jgi:hypothetical protein
MEDASGEALCRLLYVGHGFVHAVLHFVGRHVFDVGCDRPFVPERIFQFAVAVAPELI